MRIWRFKFVIWLVMLFTLGLVGLAGRALLAADLGIVFCDVGQGDASLVVAREQQMLIDGGPDQRVLGCLARFMPVGDRTLEVVVLTHPDSDHLRGLNMVLQTYKVERLVTSELFKGGADFELWYQLVWAKMEKEGLKIVVAERAQNWCLRENVCCEVVSERQQIQGKNIWQEKILYSDLLGLFTKYVPKSYSYNGGSIVIKCEIDDKKVLFSGDIEESGELALLASGLLTKVDILKVAHHGSKTSSNLNFLRVLRPEESMIMCGVKNSYGHPHQSTLEKLEEVGSRVWRTDWHGSVRFWQRGGRRWVVETDENGW
jgi:competence protein ComEC